jgi:hypothetical protein
LFWRNGSSALFAVAGETPAKWAGCPSTRHAKTPAREMLEKTWGDGPRMRVAAKFGSFMPKACAFA